MSNLWSPLLRKACGEPNHHWHDSDGKECGQKAQPERTRNQHPGSLCPGLG
jgi:hypothetical protein